MSFDNVCFYRLTQRRQKSCAVDLSSPDPILQKREDTGQRCCYDEPLTLGVYVMIELLLVMAEATSQKPTTPPPVVNTNQPAPPPIERYGDWSATIYGNGLIASTRNESGAVFGVICGEKCVTFFNPKIPCENGGSYPALINSPAQAFSVTLKCVIADGRNFYSANIDESLIDLMETGGQLGVAFPMQSGQFRVSRFSLTGALKAKLRIYNLSKAGQKNPDEKGLRDQIL